MPTPPGSSLSAKEAECLICLQSIKRLWTPPTKCPCKPFIHERCWNVWVKHMGAQICVICRGVPERRPFPAGEAAIVVAHAHAHHDVGPRRLPFYHHFFIVYGPWFTVAFIVFTLIWLQIQTRRMHFQPPLTAGRPPPMPLPIPSLRPYLLNNHDEL